MIKSNSATKNIVYAVIEFIIWIVAVVETITDFLRGNVKISDILICLALTILIVSHIIEFVKYKRNEDMNED